ncbi:MAG TPA: hypothetical protein VE135_06945 [Pyrinomonadaceae bacterium]|nr:hypothetical protein [Pyrinomonadaceae bacterium]
MERELKAATDDVPDVVVEVASRSEAGDILSSQQRCAEVTCLISIGEPNDELPLGYQNISNRVRFLFADTLAAELGATEGDVRNLIEIARNLRSSRGKVLIHCEAGISRSPAAALILYACWLGPGREDEAMRRVLAQRPLAIPNRRMVELADHLLKRDGRLLEALG